MVYQEVVDDMVSVLLSLAVLFLNPENGHAWTLNYQYSFSDKISLAAEWLSIKTHHCGWIYYGISPTERLKLRLR